MNVIDLNSDIGEGFGSYQFGGDSTIISYISSANIACGWHAGDPLTMEKTVAMAKQKGVAVGAHPGFPDLLGFGRRNMNVSYGEAKAYVQYQVGALLAFTKAAQVPLQHVKPHGAMYNMACKDEKLAAAICEGVAQVDDRLILMGPSGSCLTAAAEQYGLRIANEAFADRAYSDDGTLVSRSVPGAVIEDEQTVIKRVLTMVQQGVVESITGKQIALKAQSICIHGDNPAAIALAKNLAFALAQEGINVSPVHCFV